jgi:hypothetical protein
VADRVDEKLEYYVGLTVDSQVIGHEPTLDLKHFLSRLQVNTLV